MFKKGKIAQGVMQVIKDRVDQKERQYEQGCVEIDDKAATDKELLASKLINEVLSGK